MISNDIKYLNKILTLSDKKNIIGNSPFTKFYVYIINNEIASFLVFDDIYDRVEIIYIFTKNEYRNRGIAKMLFDKLIDDYKLYDNITLEVNKNNIVAIDLYKKLGFTTVSLRKNYYNGIDGLLMKLDL